MSYDAFRHMVDGLSLVHMALKVQEMGVSFSTFPVPMHKLPLHHLLPNDGKGLIK